jgi:hypothetical protein
MHSNLKAFALLGVLLAAVLVFAVTIPGRSQQPSGGNIPPSALGQSQAPSIAETAIADVTQQPGSANRFRYGSPNLTGATKAEFAEFARDWARVRLQPKGVPELLLARSITYEEIPTLGLGCPPPITTIEEPPLMLAILKGEFDLTGAGPGFGRGDSPRLGEKQYVMLLFDVWAARPMVIISSETGDILKKALNDPNLPDMAQPMPGVCATPIPLIQRTMHYGEVAPGFPVPTHPSLPEQSTLSPGPTPMPASTARPRGNELPEYEAPDPNVPAPVPTTGQLPVGEKTP